MANGMRIERVDAWRVRIPLVTPYHLSKVYGTLTHCDVVLLRVTTADGFEGWGEADPGGPNFTGDTAAEVMEQFRDGGAERLLGVDPEEWVEAGHGREPGGTFGAACDIAVHDALGRATGTPVWALLGTRQRYGIDLLWPTSSGTADEDLDVIEARATEGYHTFMLKAGAREIGDDVERVREVCSRLPGDCRVMVDANQGWEREQAIEFATGTTGLPLILIEQPVVAADLEGLRAVREVAAAPISVDESLRTPEHARQIIDERAADVFSIKVSKNGGLRNALDIAELSAAAGLKVLMNSMIELGVTQSASLHLGCVLENLVDCGHAYMSTLRMSDDVTDFSAYIDRARAHLPDAPGLGIEVDLDAIARYQVEEHHV